MMICGKHARPKGIGALPDGTFIVADEGHGGVYIFDAENPDAWRRRRIVGGLDFSWILPQSVCPVIVPPSLSSSKSTKVPRTAVLVCDAGRHQVVLTILGAGEDGDESVIIAGSESEACSTDPLPLPNLMRRAECASTRNR